MAETQENFSEIRANEAAPTDTQQNQVQTREVNPLVRFVSILPCIPKVEPKPPTPNIDEIKQIYLRFKKNPNETDVSVLDRVDSHDLCAWSQKILKFLPSVSGNEGAQKNGIIGHFDIIKKFYTAVRNAGFDPSPEMETFFNSIQIYESVMSVAFVVFQEHPDKLKSISDQITKATNHIEGYQSQGCCALAFCGLAILSKFNSILGAVDKLLGELGVPKVAEFIAKIIEVFCKFFNIDISDTQKISSLSESIQDLVKNVQSALKGLFGDSIPDMGRKSKWGPLYITDRIKAKLSKFEKQSVVVERTIKSFDNFFKTVETIDDNFEQLQKTQVSQQRSVASESDDPDNQKVETAPLLAQINEKQLSSMEQVTSIGHFFQHLETILSYGVLLFKNEDEILNPLLDHVDECTRILKTYSDLHPLYKILLGPNYLNKLKVETKKIIQLLDDSDLKVNSPREFLAELKQKYPNLLYLLCESLINDKLKKNLEILPDPLENALNDAFKGALNKIKFKF